MLLIKSTTWQWQQDSNPCLQSQMQKTIKSAASVCGAQPNTLHFVPVHSMICGDPSTVQKYPISNSHSTLLAVNPTCQFPFYKIPSDIIAVVHSSLSSQILATCAQVRFNCRDFCQIIAITQSNWLDSSPTPRTSFAFCATSSFHPPLGDLSRNHYATSFVCKFVFTVCPTPHAHALDQCSFIFALCSAQSCLCPVSLSCIFTNLTHTIVV